MKLEQLLIALDEGRFHSGEALAHRFGVSRTAIWNAINKLKDLGLDVQSVKGKGYRIANDIELLSQTAIMAELHPHAQAVFPAVEILLSTDSTNRQVASSMGASRKPLVCLAETQQEGRGRRGRQWVSPFAANNYLSIGWRFNQLSASLDGLSLCVGLALVRAAQRAGVCGIGLKWPNDLLFEGQKVAGVLIEIVGELSGPVQVVIGIGVNVAMTRAQGKAIDQSWTTLSDIAGHRISRNTMAALVINQLVDILPQFEQGGFAIFREEWSGCDVLQGRTVEVDMAGRKVQGVARGVNYSGELLLETATGLEPIRGGEVSVRAGQ